MWWRITTEKINILPEMTYRYPLSRLTLKHTFAFRVWDERNQQPESNCWLGPRKLCWLKPNANYNWNNAHAFSRHIKPQTISWLAGSAMNGVRIAASRSSLARSALCISDCRVQSQNKGEIIGIRALRGGAARPQARVAYLSPPPAPERAVCITLSTSARTNISLSSFILSLGGVRENSAPNSALII